MAAALACGLSTLSCGMFEEGPKIDLSGRPPALDPLRAPTKVKRDPKAVVEFTATVKGTIKVHCQLVTPPPVSRTISSPLTSIQLSLSA